MTILHVVWQCRMPGMKHTLNINIMDLIVRIV